ncbi:MAG: alpha/beta fold hydrolase [Mycoplasma sp.]
MLNQTFLNHKIIKNSKTTVVFFHGILSDSLSAPALEQICDKLNMDFISYTFPFHKENKSLKKSKDFYDYEIYEIFDYLIDRIKTKEIIIIGHSAGANWATRFYEIVKDQISVKKLILLCPILSIAKIFTVNKIKKIKDYYDKGRSHEIKRSLKNYYLVAGLFTNYNFFQRNEWVNFFFKLKSKKVTLKTEDIYKNASCPKMVIGAELDMVIDNVQAEQLFKDLCANSEYLTLKKSTHIPHQDNWEIFTDEMTKVLRAC